MGYARKLQMKIIQTIQLCVLATIFNFSCGPDKSTKLDSGSPKNPNEETWENYTEYYADGNIREKGFLLKNDRIGWWLTYINKGQILKKREFIIKDKESYLNQEIIFNHDGSVNHNKSSYFKISVPDTIPVGKTVAKLEYVSKPTEGYKTRFVYIIVQNEYPGNIIRKDTFTDDLDKLWFGVFASKKGPLTIKGTIEEELSYLKILHDSSSFTVKKSFKQFEKTFWVK